MVSVTLERADISEQIQKQQLQDVLILDLSQFTDSKPQLNFSKTEQLLDKVKETGSIWLIANHTRLNEKIVPYSFELADFLISSGLYLRNIITWFIPKKENEKQRLTNRYSHIFLFVKDPKDYYFNKDLIREKHIWKGVEWGKRKGRYHPLGKDPGNVWLMTEDNGNGLKTKHVPLTWQQVIERIKSVSCPNNGKIALFSSRVSSNLNIATQPIDSLIDLCKNKINFSNMVGTKRANKKNLIYSVFNQSSENMPNLKSESVDLIVTSPPYWDMKNYRIQNQIGFMESYSTYLSRINSVWKECYRTLNPKGTFWLNINTKMDKGSLKLIFHDFIKQCLDLGFKLWDIVIWHKSVSGPAPQNNLTDKFEYVLIFYKEKGFYFNEEYSNRLKSDYLINGTSSLGNVWNINRFWGSIGKEYPHPAMYPDELIQRILELGTVKGDLVLDPFLGSGTTLLVSKKLLRSCIGYEINSKYFKLLNKRISDEKLDNLFNYRKVEFN